MVIIIGGQAAVLIWEWTKIGYVLSHPSQPPHPIVGQPGGHSPHQGRAAEGPPHPTPCSTPLWARVHVLHINKMGTRQTITTSKGERAFLQSLIQKEKTNQMCFETCLLLELRQTRVDMTLKTSILICTMYNAGISNLSLTSAKAAL